MNDALSRQSLGLLLALSLAAPASAQQFVSGDVYSYVRDGVRHYSSTPPPAGSAEIRKINYSFIEGADEVVEPFVYRCPLANGTFATVSKPYFGCTVVGTKKAAKPVAQARRFHGYGCTQDCSGHEAGYQWAEENGITNPDDCGGNSQSFIEGCRAWAEEDE